MKKLRVSIDGVGSCNIDSILDIEPRSEFVIKSLAGLQLMCINVQKDDKYKEFVDILGDAVDRISEVYEGENERTEFGIS